MSQQNDYPIACPECGNEFEATLYDAVTLSDEPDAKQALLANTLNKVTCPKCEAEFRVDKALLYNDAANGLMIYWMPAPPEQIDVVKTHFEDMMRAMAEITPEGVEPPKVQLVLQRIELIERIFLHDHGLEPAVVEYVKHLLYTRNLEKLPPAEKNLLFNAGDSTEENLLFVVQDANSRQLEGGLEFPREAYQALLDALHGGDEAAAAAQIGALFPGPYISARALLMAQDADGKS